MKIRHYLAIAMCAVALAGCSNSKPQTVQYFQGDEEQLYVKAADSLLAGKYSAAEPIITQLTLQFPFGLHKNETQVLQAYTSYKTDNYELALSQINKYFQGLGTKVTPNGDYMLLLHALSSIEANRGVFQNLFNLNRADNDLQDIQVAITDLREIKKFYAASPYITYASNLENYLTNLVAQHNYKVAEFYLKYDNPLAAYKRANIVLINFPDSEYAKPALNILKTAGKKINVNLDPQVAQLASQIASRTPVKAITEMPQPIDLTPDFLAQYRRAPAAK